MKGKIIFTEVQHFRNTWVWYITLAVTILTVILMGQGVVQQLLTGKPWGDKPMSDAMLVVVALSSVAIMVAILVFIYLHELILQVDEGSILYKYYPYFNRFREAGKADLISIEVRKYSPISEYGGWGYRIGGRKNKAFNIKGNKGLQLKFKDGRKLLIGTQKPNELSRAIQRLRENWERS